VETALKNVAALLGSLGRPLEITTVDHRKVMQKAAYLSQALGLPTNYQFSWYKYGPYSPRLAKDYYALGSLALRGEAIDGYRLSAQFAPVAERLRQLFDRKPPGQSEADWAELLASVHFLARESEVPNPKEIIQEKKSHLAQYYDAAKDALEQAGLLQQ
jgi:uncharacterized protein YwgA